MDDRGTVLRDAIWGDISLGPRELAVIDTPGFQRLRRVRQLGFTDLVFPGARHTRFEHSLGVFHLAGLAVDHLSEQPSTPSISDEDRRTFLAAALLHDVGHYPFSHAVEELEVDAVRRHEDIARDLITSGDIADALTSAWDVSPERVSVLVAGSRRGDEPLDEATAILRTVLDSGLDVDKLDYLVRDARGANVPYGLVDVQRLIRALAVWRGADGRPRLAVDLKGVAALQSLVFAKHLMFSTVYWHHACRSAVSMLLRAIQEALEVGALERAALEQADDAQLMSLLSGDGMPDRTRELAARITARRLYKRAVEITVDHPAFERLERLWFRPTQRRTLEDGWAAAAGARPGDVLCDIPEPKAITVDLPVVLTAEQTSGWDRVAGLGAHDLARYQRWVRRIRVFASSSELAERIRASEGELLHVPA